MGPHPARPGRGGRKPAWKDRKYSFRCPKQRNFTGLNDWPNNSGAARAAPPKKKPNMHPNSESEVESGDEAEALGERQNDAEQEATRRAAMIGRACERRANWQRELAAERFDEFKPEMRRRIQVEQTLIDGLEQTKTSTFILLRNYQRDAVHMPAQPKTEREQERADLLERIGKATQRRKDLLGTLELTPQRQVLERKELLRKIAKGEEYVRDLQAKVRATQA